MINAIQIALSGLNAASRKVEAAASNIANMTTEGALDPADGPAPYQALTMAQTSVSGDANRSSGVESRVIPSTRPVVPVYHPDSPYANADGLTGAPNVDLAEEAVNLQIAEVTYKANLKTIQTASDMQHALLDIFDRDS